MTMGKRKRGGDWVPVATTGRLPLPEAMDLWLENAATEAAADAAGQRVSHGITYSEFCDAYEAFAFANCCGVVLDTRVDVTWSTIGLVSEAMVARAHRAFLELLGVRLGQMTVSLTYVAVHEVGTTRDLHTHYTMFVPPGLAKPFERICATSLAAAAKRTLNLARDSRTLNVDVGEQSVSSQWSRFRYVMKGVSPNAALPAAAGEPVSIPLWQFAELGDHFGFQGHIAMPRVEISSSLAAVRRAAARNEYPDIPDMSVRASGPQLYGTRFWDWHRARTGQPHFEGELASRRAEHLAVGRGRIATDANE